MVATSCVKMLLMDSFYRGNESETLKPGAAEAFEQSRQRRVWFASFETRLRTRLTQDLQAIQFTIVGSVARNEAKADSDIDVVISYANDGELPVARIRQQIVSLLGEMVRAGEVVFPINIHVVGQSSEFSRIAVMDKNRN